MADGSDERRRNSITRGAAMKQRPKLLRSSATEPSITGPNAVRGSLVIPTSPNSAAEILSKMAIYSLASTESDDYQVARHMIGHQQETTMTPQDTTGQVDGAHKEDSLLDINSDRYYSFPSFEGWDVGQRNLGRSDYD
ncbi:hypothetical protein HJFPF1_06822 [Paramyrothecium foliicola]|nr:hypothetical protein HJFPF1_06822 [Paramyrothecium foliicola]